RSAVLQNVDVINQPKWKQVEVHCTTEKSIEVVVIAGKTISRETTSVLQHKSFFGSKTTQIDFRLAITEGIYVFIDRRSGSRGQLLNKVSGTAHTEPLDIDLAIGVDRLRPDFFRGRNVRASYDNLERCSNRLAAWLRRGYSILGQRSKDWTKDWKPSRKCCSHAPVGRLDLPSRTFQTAHSAVATALRGVRRRPAFATLRRSKHAC